MSVSILLCKYSYDTVHFQIMQFPKNMPKLLKLCLCGRASTQRAEAQMANQTAGTSGDKQVSREAEGADSDAPDNEGDFSLGKYTMRTMTGSMVVAHSTRPKDLLAVMYYVVFCKFRAITVIDILSTVLRR